MKCIAQLLVLCLAVVTGAACASDDDLLLQQVVGQLEFRQGVTGDFRQEKHLHFMQRPLVSTGTFSMDRSDGLRWQVTEPVVSLMTVQDQMVVLDGKPMKDQGVGQLMAMIMLGFMDGELAGLGRSFAVSGNISDDGWQLLLTPDTLLLRSALEGIELSGNHHLEQIEVVEKSMTRTLITFDGVRELQVVNADAESD